jgi:hypothetical protein
MLMRQVLTLFVAVAFTLGLAGAALAQSTTTTPGSSSSQTAPAPSGTAPTPPPTTDASKPSTDPSKSATDPTKSSTDTSKGAVPGAGKTGQDKAMGHDKAKTAAGSMRGQHRMMGEVTKVDATKGTVSLKTDEGDMDLHFPPSALQGIKEGDRVEVQMAIRPAAGSAASKDMGKPAAAPKAGKSTSSTDPGAAKPKTTP